MAANIQQHADTSAKALAVAANHYAEAKSRDDAESQAAWRKVIYSLVASKQYTLV